MSLPSHYLITPTPEHDTDFLAALESCLQAGTRLIQLKRKGIDPQAYRTLAQRVIPLAHRYHAKVLLSEPALVGQLGADFAVLSPILYTSAHPDINPIGWEGLAEIVSKVKLPIYALGGVSADDETKAIRAGAQGVAGNRGYWKA